MGQQSFTPAKSAFSRVFIIPGRARPDHDPEFQACMKAGAVDWSFGDIEPIQCPDPENYGQFDEVGQIRGAIERASSSLAGRYAANLASRLLGLAKLRCQVDVHVHFGVCTDPRVFNAFTKAVILENVALPTWSTEELGAMSSDENAPVAENVDLNIGNVDEALPMTFQKRAGDTVQNEVVDVVNCSAISCGDECSDEDEGCEKIFALAGATTGSPGTAPDVLYSEDKGVNWGINEIDSLLPAESADALACVLDYVVVVSGASCSMHYKSKADVLLGTVGDWTEVTTGFVAAKCPNDIWSVGYSAFIVGDGGYVYYTDDPTSSVSVLDAGVATTNNLQAVHALDDKFAVAVGASDTIIYTTNRYNWVAATATGGGNTLQAVWCKNEKEWFVVDNAGGLYYTLDGGNTWTEKGLPGTVTELHDVQMASDSVMYVAGRHDSSGRIWRSYDGGFSFVALPEGISSLPEVRDINAIAACSNDINHLCAVGEGATLNDGVILVGED
jgi:hypothetical protein